MESSESLSVEQLRFESIILGLRTKDGFDQGKIPPHHPSRDMLPGLQDTGFIRIANGMVLPTRKGFLVADYLAYCLGG